jgi:hypothetical protein
MSSYNQFESVLLLLLPQTLATAYPNLDVVML